MGAFTDNLLKLTDFPFSYSLIGLLALIFGEGLNPNDPAFFTQLGPLLILMGFVATVLSITDPIGTLQKLFLGGLQLPARRATTLEYKLKNYAEVRPADHRHSNLRSSEGETYIFEWETNIFRKVEGMGLFGRTLYERFQQKDLLPTVVLCLLSDFRNYLAILDSRIVDWPFDELSPKNVKELALKIQSLKREAVGTTWIVREVDKITAMIYFIIIISIFIYAEYFVSGFLGNFELSFQADNQTGSSSATIGAGTTNVTMGTTATTINPWIPNIPITLGKIFFDLLTGGSPATVIIRVFSFIALGAISYMVYRRLSGLESKAWITFRFLLEHDAIKIENERFKPILVDTERYLDNGDWIMAEHWVERIMNDYDSLIREEPVKAKKLEEGW